LRRRKEKMLEKIKWRLLVIGAVLEGNVPLQMVFTAQQVMGAH
jgi:hypothetical protein